MTETGPAVVRVAMWSGPRNISTAMMRAWSSRHDTVVTDEPLYSYYLRKTGLDHPGRDEIIAAYDSDWQHVIQTLTGPPPEPKPIWFQKHMTQHLLPEISREWIAQMRNCFLIREPRDVLASYSSVRSRPTLDDLGLPQQVEIFEHVRRVTGSIPPIMDARDVLLNPRGILQQLCERLGIPFTGLMLSWAPGRRKSDGIWAEYWYRTAENSTGFIPYKPRTRPLSPQLEELAAECDPYYRALAEFRLQPVS